MFHKYFGLIATVALTFSPVAAFAEETQANSGSALGSGNTFLMIHEQDCNLNQMTDPLCRSFFDSQPQVEDKNAKNRGAAIVTGSTVHGENSANSGSAVGSGNTFLLPLEQDMQSTFGF